MKALRKSLVFGASLSVLAHPALAQSAAEAELAARSANEESSEIVVTAQRREERLLDTPISIQVLNGEQLDRDNVRSVGEAVSRVGGVSVSEVQPGKTSIYIRGVVPGIGSPTAAFYQDEVPFSFVRYSFLPDAGAYDLARVEVLRGPQGTLYGANSLSGAVRVLSNDPDTSGIDFKGRIRGSRTEGGGDNLAGDAMANLVLVQDKLAVRMVGGYSDSTGFISSRVDGKQNINDGETENYRAKILWKPTANLTIIPGYIRSVIRNDNTQEALDDLSSPFASSLPDRRELDVASLTIKYDWPTLSLLSATGHIDYEAVGNREEMLGGDFRLPYLEADTLSAFSQEVRLVSALNGPWQWSSGVFYQKLEQATRQEIDLPGILVGTFRQNTASKSYAIFGEITRSFADNRLEVIGGLRYFHDRQKLEDLEDFDPNAILLPDQKATFKRTTGRLVLNYKPSRNSLYYASISTGFRSGAIQSPAVVRIDPTFAPVKPDSLISYELGSKGSLHNRLLNYDVAVYYTDWKDIQQSLTLPNQFTARVNSGRAKGIGVDAGISLDVTPNLSLYSSIGWNKLKISEAVFIFSTAAQQNLLLFPKGSRVNDSPEWTVNLGGNYRVASPLRGVHFAASADYSFGSSRQRRFLTGSAISVSESDPIDVLRARIGLEGKRWTLDVFGDNLLNEKGAVTPRSDTFGNTATRLRPRTIGLQLTAKY
jgi:outer membrane receptor protein involved in Fe transport